MNEIQDYYNYQFFLFLLTIQYALFQYGGDITRRKKLLKQQAEGKKKMRSIANIKIPRNTFIDVLKR